MMQCQLGRCQNGVDRRSRTLAGVSFLSLLLSLSTPLFAVDNAPYLEPGMLRLSHTASLEGVFHRLRNGEEVFDRDIDKTYLANGNGKNKSDTEWGQSLLTEVATRLNKSITARVLFNVQGDYADRYWRPVNFDHYEDKKGNHVYLREGEANFDQETWYLHGFSGTNQNGWGSKGDLFNFYPGVYPQRDYLGSTGYFGVYPENWQASQYLNISKRRIPQGGEVGGVWGNVEAAAVYGSELEWGYNHNASGRIGTLLGEGRLTFFYKDADVPYTLNRKDDERSHSYALTWTRPSEEGWGLNAGLVYKPFRVGDSYAVDRDADGGSGVLGSSHNIGTKIVHREDGLGAKVKLDGVIPVFSHPLKTQLSLERTGVVAGNKEEAGLQLGSDIGRNMEGFVSYVYRRPVEGPIPFLFEGTPDNIGAVVANPRGPESPFTVDWFNREASILTTTLNFDLTPGSNMYINEPTNIAVWNMNPQEEAPLSFSLQHRMSDYKTPTDRQFYYDESGNITWEPAGHSGAWASNHPLHEFRVLSHGVNGKWKWTAGVAGGQASAVSALAYSTSTAHNKPVTEYVSVEARIERGDFAWWGHYGTGVWGPEENIHPYFGESYDRVFGLGVSYNVTRYTTWDLSYLGARQDDDLFRVPTLGSFDEIRTVFSHRFGFIFMFKDPSRAGTIVR